MAAATKVSLLAVGASIPVTMEVVLLAACVCLPVAGGGGGGVDVPGSWVRCDRRPRVQDFGSAGGATPAVAGPRYLVLRHSMVAATKVLSLVVGVNSSVARQLGLRIN